MRLGVGQGLGSFRLLCDNFEVEAQKEANQSFFFSPWLLLQTKVTLISQVNIDFLGILTDGGGGGFEAFNLNRLTGRPALGCSSLTEWTVGSSLAKWGSTVSRSCLGTLAMPLPCCGTLGTLSPSLSVKTK